MLAKTAISTPMIKGPDSLTVNRPYDDHRSHEETSFAAEFS